MALHLWQVKVWPDANVQRLLGIVEEVEAKIKQGCAAGLAIHDEVLLYHVPAAGTNQQGGELIVWAQPGNSRTDANSVCVLL